MFIPTIITKYLLHKGIELKHQSVMVTDELIDSKAEEVKNLLAKAIIVRGNLIDNDGNDCKIFSYKFKNTRIKLCKLNKNINRVTDKSIEFLIIENVNTTNTPLILYHHNG